MVSTALLISEKGESKNVKHAKFLQENQSRVSNYRPLPVCLEETDWPG
jgi:hypothetical protein